MGFVTLAPGLMVSRKVREPWILVTERLMWEILRMVLHMRASMIGETEESRIPIKMKPALGLIVKSSKISGQILKVAKVFTFPMIINIK